MAKTDPHPLKTRLLRLLEQTPQLQAALRPVTLLERQAGEHRSSADSLLAAYEAGAGVTERQPAASRPFEAELVGSRLDAGQRLQAGILLLGTELRRGLYTYRLAGLTPGSSERELAAALKQRLEPEGRERLEALHGWLEAQGRHLEESDLYLAAWSEGLRFASNDHRLAREVAGQDDSGFVRIILDWGRRLGERTRRNHGGDERPSLH